MRTLPGLVAVVLLAALPGLAGPAATSTSAPSSGAAWSPHARGPASYAFVRAQVFRVPGRGAVAVGMPGPRRVSVQHLDPATGAWSDPVTLYQGRGVTCGEIHGRASAGGVALLLLCDTPYYEDQAPTHSVAMVTRDLRSWSRTVLPGEAYRAPAISPSGEHAAWVVGGGAVVRFQAGAGFGAPLQTGYDGEGAETVVVDDTGTVEVIGPSFTAEGRCVLGVFRRTPSGARSTSAVEGVEPGCTEGMVENVDAHTVRVTTSGWDRWSTSLVTRADSATLWRLARLAPESAPGLVRYPGALRRSIPAWWSDDRDGALVSYGSPDRRRVLAQVYDERAQRWQAPVQVYDHGFPGCTAGDPVTTYGEPGPRLHVVPLHCYPVRRADGVYPPRGRHGPAPADRVRLLVSWDGERWQVLSPRRRPFAVSASGDLVAVPAARGVRVLSAAGARRLPVRLRHGCGLVFPTGPGLVVRLDGRRGDAWPTRLQRRVPGKGWVTIQTVRMPTTGRCRWASAIGSSRPSAFLLHGTGDRVVPLTVRRAPGGWRVVRRAGY